METIQTIIQWHTETFPDATLAGQLEKFYEEEQEFIQDYDPTEFADMFIVACGIARFSISDAIPKFAIIYNNMGASADSWKKFQELVDEKMRINRQRKWNKLNGLYKHQA